MASLPSANLDPFAVSLRSSRPRQCPIFSHLFGSSQCISNTPSPTNLLLNSIQGILYLSIREREILASGTTYNLKPGLHSDLGSLPTTAAQEIACTMPLPNKAFLLSIQPPLIAPIQESQRQRLSEPGRSRHFSYRC